MHKANAKNKLMEDRTSSIKTIYTLIIANPINALQIFETGRIIEDGQIRAIFKQRFELKCSHESL